MSRVFAALLSLVVALSVFPVEAANPHFTHVSVTGLRDDGTLLIEFREAGLGNNQGVMIGSSVAGSVLMQCTPEGDGFERELRMSFSSDKNGQITGSLVLSPRLECRYPHPPDTKPVLLAVSYYNIKIMDYTNNLVWEIPGTFSPTY